MNALALPFKIDRAVELDAIEKRKCELSLVEFIKAAWHVVEPVRKYVHNWHTDLIAAHLTAITDETQFEDGSYYNKLLINVPPGTMKSLMVAVFWPAWEWGPRNMPHLRILSSSFSESRAMIDSNRMRDLVKSEWYQRHWGDRFRLLKDGEGFFDNDHKGWRRARPFSSLTGDRGDRALVDDPHSTEQAESETERKRTTRIFRESLPTRMNDPERSATVVVMQRLNEDDVSGVILENDMGYDHICLPMRFDPVRRCKTWLGYEDPRTEDGELLFPARFPEYVVDQLEADLGPYATAGQFAQSPAPRGGGIIQRDWWQLWGSGDREKDRSLRYPKMDYVIAWLDGAYTEKSENDPSAMTVWGIFGEKFDGATRMVDRDGKVTALTQHKSEAAPYLNDTPRAMLMYAWEARLPLHELVVKAAKTGKEFGVDLVLIENKATGISVAQEMQRLFGHEGFQVRLVDPGAMDKVGRLQAVQPLFAEGMVYAPKAAWSDAVINQVASFPRGKHDDYVDCTSGSLNFMRQTGMLRRTVERLAELEDVMTHRGGPLPPLYGGI